MLDDEQPEQKQPCQRRGREYGIVARSYSPQHDQDKAAKGEERHREFGEAPGGIGGCKPLQLGHEFLRFERSGGQFAFAVWFSRLAIVQDYELSRRV